MHVIEGPVAGLISRAPLTRRLHVDLGRTASAVCRMCR